MIKIIFSDIVNHFRQIRQWDGADWLFTGCMAILAGILFLCIDSCSTHGSMLNGTAVSKTHRDSWTEVQYQNIYGDKGQVTGIIPVIINHPERFGWNVDVGEKTVDAETSRESVDLIHPGSRLKVWETHGWITGTVYGHTIPQQHLNETTAGTSAAR